MKIGIISDTHDNPHNLAKAIEIFKGQQVGLIIHCGDWATPALPGFCHTLNPPCKIISVFGNNEGDIYTMLDLKDKEGWNMEFYKGAKEIEEDGRKLIAYHGDCQPILDALIDCQKYDAVFYGHNHIPAIEKKGKTLCVNSGTISNLRRFNLNDEYTVAVYDTGKNYAEIIKL